MSSGLPGWLAAALRDRASAGGGHLLAEASERLSAHYRRSESSAIAISDADDALAYALSRMPATYAAVSTALTELVQRAPGFAPHSILDAGAGPGTATWAAAQTWSGVTSAMLVDSNPHLLGLARELLPEGGPAATFVSADLSWQGRASFDLVMAAYALTELPDATLGRAVTGLWSQTEGVLMIVEPGRPREYARLMKIRHLLVGEGARILAPCPHEKACPLVAPDWCHFSVRLPRGRDHMRLKGGSLGYEDEKFSYLVAARPAVARPAAAARVIKPPRETKVAVQLDLCTTDGLEVRAVPSRDRPAFKAAKSLRWGDPLA